MRKNRKKREQKLRKNRKKREQRRRSRELRRERRTKGRAEIENNVLYLCQKKIQNTKKKIKQSARGLQINSWLSPNISRIFWYKKLAYLAKYKNKKEIKYMRMTWKWVCQAHSQQIEIWAG